MVIRRIRCTCILFSESEWSRTRNKLGFLDLANYDGNLYKCYERKFVNHFNQKAVFERPWITVTCKHDGYSMDDCRVLFKWFSNETDSIFFDTAMKSRDPDWLGRNIFLKYFDSIIKQERYLESGESAVNFLHVATLCGFSKWGKTSVTFRRTDRSGMTAYRVCNIAKILFHRIYPSIVRGLYQIREKHPLLIKTVWDMFCFSRPAKCMLFARIPDAQHLKFLLDVANQTSFNFWGIRDGECSYFEGALCCFIVQKRFDLLTILLRHGFTFKGSPLTVIKIIIKSMFPFHRKFTATASPEFMEMFRKLLVSLPFPFESPSILRVKLEKFYACLIIKEEGNGNEICDGQRKDGRKLVHKLVKSYATCGIDCEDEAPRTLRHLSRHIVRTLLGGNFQLPAGIDALPVSEEVKDFLNLGS